MLDARYQMPHAMNTYHAMHTCYAHMQCTHAMHTCYARVRTRRSRMPAPSRPRSMHVVCMWYACGTHVVCMWYACGMHVVCMWYACGTHVVRMWYACGTHVVCMWWALLTAAPLYRGSTLQWGLGSTDCRTVSPRKKRCVSEPRPWKIPAISTAMYLWWQARCTVHGALHTHAHTHTHTHAHAHAHVHAA